MKQCSWDVSGWLNIDWSIVWIGTLIWLTRFTRLRCMGEKSFTKLNAKCSVVETVFMRAVCPRLWIPHWVQLQINSRNGFQQRIHQRIRYSNGTWRKVEAEGQLDCGPGFETISVEWMTRGKETASSWMATMQISWCGSVSKVFERHTECERKRKEPPSVMYVNVVDRSIRIVLTKETSFFNDSGSVHICRSWQGRWRECGKGKRLWKRNRKTELREPERYRTWFIPLPPSFHRARSSVSSSWNLNI